MDERTRFSLLPFDSADDEPGIGNDDGAPPTGDGGGSPRGEGGGFLLDAPGDGILSVKDRDPTTNY